MFVEPEGIGKRFGDTVALAEVSLRLSHFRDSGGSVPLITHRVDKALAVSDEVPIQRRGRGVLA